MLGAIAGDIIGSIYERNPVSDKAFPLFQAGSRFTDDTVLTVAIADSLLNDIPFQVNLRRYAKRYPRAGYGGTFIKWMLGAIDGPYNSWGNGSAMRVSPVGFAYEEIPEILQIAQDSAAVTHNHPEGIKGAQAVALAIYMARSGFGKPAIRERIQRTFQYDLQRKLAAIQPDYTFDVSCQGSVPESILAFLESDSWESAVRNAIWLGGDSDTMACIAGSIAEAFYGEVPEPIKAEAFSRLPEEFCETITHFYSSYDWQE